MKPQHLLTSQKHGIYAALMLITAISLSACSNNQPTQPQQQKYKTIQTMNQPQRVETGKVIAVSDVTPARQNLSPFSHIGISASSSGFRGIYGAINLASLGHLLNHGKSGAKTQQIIVKKANGETIAITQLAQQTLKKGDTVNILQRHGKTHVIR